jgi:hypothetical protein
VRRGGGAGWEPELIKGAGPESQYGLTNGEGGVASVSQLELITGGTRGNPVEEDVAGYGGDRDAEVISANRGHASASAIGQRVKSAHRHSSHALQYGMNALSRLPGGIHRYLVPVWVVL